MTRERKKWGIRPGDPTRLGSYPTADGYNFAVETESREPLELIFYKRGTEEPEKILELSETMRTGDVYAVVVMESNLSLYEYVYRQGKQIFADPCASVWCGLGTFGEKKEEDFVPGSRVLSPKKVEQLECAIPFEEMILYKVHPRGYTMQKGSKTRKKGTFRGLREKIPYWKELGITSVELMPSYEFFEYPPKEEMGAGGQNRTTRVSRLNYWGYTKGNYFAPKASYSASEKPDWELKDLISALHKEGMECLMDFCFPKEIPPELVLQVLRFWYQEYGVDGFVLVGDGVWMELLARDSLLAGAKLLGPGYDFDRIYGVRRRLPRRIGEYQPGFQDSIRCFLKGDEDQINGFFYHNHRNPVTHGVVNYMANHDGFTLADMVAYDYRHNEENGEENRDGNSWNHSWNCGTEGPTKKTKILELRKHQMMNAILLLLLSQGTPLIYGGDEFGNTQNGNNNAYCQDNEIGWVDWSGMRRFAGFTQFVQKVIAFRKAHPILHMPYELRPSDYKSLGWPELSYHSDRAWFANTESSSRHAGVLYCGSYAEREDGTKDDFIYVMYNMHASACQLALPDLPEGMKWYLAIDSAQKPEQAVYPVGEEKKIKEKKSFRVEGRTILVLIGK